MKCCKSDRWHALPALRILVLFEVERSGALVGRRRGRGLVSVHVRSARAVFAALLECGLSRARPGAAKRAGPAAAVARRGAARSRVARPAAHIVRRAHRRRRRLVHLLDERVRVEEATARALHVHPSARAQRPVLPVIPVLSEMQSSQFPNGEE